MKIIKSVFSTLLITFFFTFLTVNAQTVLVNWNFENGNDHGFTLSSLHPATPAAEDSTVAGDEALTGGWEPGNLNNLPEAGVAWTVGSPIMFNGLKPGADPGSARIDIDSLLDYSLGKARIGYVNTGSLNTYLLNMHGDHIQADTNDQIATSPQVILGSNMYLSALSWGGGPGLAPAFDTDPTQGYVTGSSGIAVLSAKDSTLLASMSMANHGDLGVDTLDLSAFAGDTVIIQVVDAFEGGWGWLAVDEIQIGTEILEMPAPAVSEVSWTFENGNDDGFILSSLKPATPAADDPSTAGDESLTGGWEPGNANNLPEAGVAWTVGSPAMYNGLLPGGDPDNARIDSNGVLDYSLGKARIGFVNTGSLNTYLLNMHGDHIQNADNDQVATSPPILLGDNMFLSATSWGGGPGLAPAFDSDPTQGYVTGSSGIAVLSADDSTLLASLSMANHGSEGVDTLDLSPFGGLNVVIQVVDAFDGGWGWLAVDEIHIGTDIIQLPAPPEQITWDFENGNDEGFTLSSLKPATPAVEDPTVAGDEALTGGWDPADTANLPQAGVAWTVGSPSMYNGLLPGGDPDNARIDSNGVLDYSLGKARIGLESTGSLNTYLLNMHGDHVQDADNDQIATSPPVLLGDNMWLSATSWGGGPGLAPEFDADPTQGYVTGSSGIAVLSADDSTLLASMSMANHGDLGVDSLDLSPFAGLRVIFQVVDAFDGGWGWLAVDKIHIGPDLLKVPVLLGLVSEWPMNEGKDTVVTDIVGGNNGAIIGLDPSTAWIADGGISFDNVDGHHIEIPDADNIDFGDESFSVSLLVRYLTPPIDTDRWLIKGTHSFIDGSATGSRYEIFHTSGETVRFTIDNNDVGKTKLEVPNTDFVTGDWVHVVAVRDADNDTLMIYANGKFEGGETDVSGDISNGEPLYIGESTDETATAMSGDIKDVRIYSYALSADDVTKLFDTYAITGVENGSGTVPLTYALGQNYPNPFNPTTTFQFQIPKEGHVTVSVYNVLGQRVTTLVDRNMKSGIHEVTFNAANFASGIYFYRLKANDFSQVKKMMLLK